MTPASISKKVSLRICTVPYCRRKARPQRRKCNTCTKREWRERNPIEYRYDNLRTHAKERRKDFTLTLAEFRKFCEETDYHNATGLHPDAVTVDRVRPEQGYSANNIRPLSHQANSERRDTPPDLSDLEPIGAEGYTRHNDPFEA
jgi:hypothetical protein